MMFSHQSLRLGLVGPQPPPNGGMAMQTEQLERLLEGEGIMVVRVVTNMPHPAVIAKLRGLRAVYRLFPYLWNAWRMAGQVDVIHLMANSGWSWQLFAAPVLWIGCLRRTPVIVNYRGGEADAYFQRSFKYIRPSLRKAALVVVPSGYLQSVFQQFGESVEVVPNIIDRECFRPVERGSGGQNFTLVITRNLEKIYGLDTAIRALAMVLEQAPGVHLRIAGSGPEYNNLQALAKTLGVGQHVSFEGRLDRRGIVELYHSADAMLNPTTVDNMPNSVLEALACGLPVISSNVGGVPYIVEHEKTALLVTPADPHAMAQAILRIRQDSSLRGSLRANGLNSVEQYSWENVRDQWIGVYLSVLHRNPQ